MEESQNFLNYFKINVAPTKEESCRVYKSSYENLLAFYSQTSKNLSSVQINNVQFDKVKTFVESCCSGVLNFDVSCKEDLDSLDLIEVLNLMPNLEKLSIFLGAGWKINGEEEIYESPKKSKIDAKLKLPKLKVLHIKSLNPSIYEFFAKFLPQNQIVEHHLVKIYYKKDFDEKLHEAILKFFETQKSIRKVNAGISETLKALNFLQLDELGVGSHCEVSEVISALKSQPQLKVLRNSQMFLSNEDEEKIFDEICKLSNLETLEVKYFTSGNFNLIQNLKNLKELLFFGRLKNFELCENFKWIESKFESLEKLIVPENKIEVEEIFDCFPNLKVLDCKSSMKLNNFAKFRKLEGLKVSYEKLKNFEVFEVEFGNQNFNLNLKVLQVHAKVSNFWDFSQNISEVCEIFPNLEILNFEVEKLKSDWSEEKVSNPQNLFANFNDFEKLKRLTLSKIPINFCEIFFSEIADELKKLASKLKIATFEFEDKIEFDEEFSYQKLLDELNEAFEVEFNETVEVLANETNGDDFEEENGGNEKRDYKKIKLRINKRD